MAGAKRVKEGEVARPKNRAIWRDFSELGANDFQLRAGVTFAVRSVNRCKTWNTSRLICFHVRLVHLSHLKISVFLDVGRESQGTWSQDELIGGKSRVVE